MKRSGHWLAVWVMVSISLLSACAAPKSAPAPAPSPLTSPPPAPAPAPQLSDWDKVVAAAKKEGTVTMYTSWGNVIAEPLQTGMKQYGIKVDVVAGQGSDLELRIVTEQRAKAGAADVFTGGFTNQVNVAKAGLAQPVTIALPVLGDKNVWKLDPTKYLQQLGAYVTGTNITPGVMINTDFVKPDEIRSWQDLLDPKWRDKIVMTDARTGSGPGASGLGVWMTLLGEDYWKKMVAQRITMQVRYDLVVAQVVSGEKPVGLFPANNIIVPPLRAGAPLALVPLREGDLYMVNGLVVVKDAPHPNAALLLLNWYLSKEGQTALSKAQGFYVIRKDITPNWLIPQMNPDRFNFLEPPANVDPTVGRKAAEFANKIFGAR